MKKLMKTVLGVWCMVLGAGAALAAELPFDPFVPFVPPSPQRSDLTKYSDGTEPIMFFLQHFMAGDSSFKFDEYNDRIRNDDEDYEAYICRGFTWLTSLSEDKDVIILVKKFGFMVNDEYGTINFSPVSSFDFGSGLQHNRDIDAACEKAVPVLKAALADFEKVPKNWSGSVDFQEGFDVPVSFDYADSLVARSVVSEMLSFLYLMKGYNTVAADGTTKPIDLEALAEARRWMKTAAEFANAFVIAQDARTDFFKDYFFNLNVIEAMVLRENARNLVDVSDWTVQFDLVLISPFFFLTGDCQSDETKNLRRKAKREKINGVGTLDVTLRNVFEGKLSADDGTFPSLHRGAPLLDASVPDPTFAGTFPGISRTVLAELLSAMADEEVSKNVESIPGEEIAHYGVFYNLPEGAENNPGNPATFSADLESPIMLQNPSMAGYLFTGWAPYGVIQVGADRTLQFMANFVESQPVTPGEPVVFDTAEEAANAMERAELAPSEEVAAALGSDAARATYRDMFEFDVVPTSDGKWAVEALLKPTEWTNVVESAHAATRQIPVADIAALGMGVETNVTARGCVPGFYYTLYGAAGVRALPMTGTAYGSVLCGADRDVEFFGVVKPSDAAGFFTIGVLEVPTFYVAGEDSSPTGIPPYLPGHPPVRH